MPAAIRKIKDITFAFEEFAILLSQHFTNHYYILIGPVLEQEYFQNCQKVFEEIKNKYNLNKRVIYHGALSYPDCIKCLKDEVDLVINLSISEGMSSSLVEAMTVGVPLLARANEGNMVLIKDLQTGYLFNDEKEFFEKYKLVFNDLNLRQQII